MLPFFQTKKTQKEKQLAQIVIFFIKKEKIITKKLKQAGKVYKLTYIIVNTYYSTFPKYYQFFC